MAHYKCYYCKEYHRTNTAGISLMNALMLRTYLYYELYLLNPLWSEVFFGLDK